MVSSRYDLCLRDPLRAVVDHCFHKSSAVMDPASFRAQGKLVTLLAVLLQSAGVTPIKEFSEMLGIFAVVVAEKEPEEGEMLAGWAAMVRDFAQSDPSGVVSDQIS